MSARLAATPDTLTDVMSIASPSSLPSRRVRLAGATLALSFVLGLPGALAIEAVALSQGLTGSALLAGPALYGLSWLLFGLAVGIGGRELGTVALRRRR